MREVNGIRNAGLVLGIGLGGFVDGILLHQLLGWHHLLSSIYPPDNMSSMRINETADGLFHAAMWLITFTGIVMLYRAGRHASVDVSSRIFAGALVAGWGLFNLVEGIVNHMILGIHHVQTGPNQTTFDIGFLVLSVILIVIGARLMTAGQQAAARATTWRGPI